MAQEAKIAGLPARTIAIGGVLVVILALHRDLRSESPGNLRVGRNDENFAGFCRVFVACWLQF
jgi:hypothetical protein